jgi:hypothetical protein
MKKKLSISIVMAVGLGVLVLAFQNCGQIEFSSLTKGALPGGTAPGMPPLAEIEDEVEIEISDNPIGLDPMPEPGVGAGTPSAGAGSAPGSGAGTPSATPGSSTPGSGAGSGSTPGAGSGGGSTSGSGAGSAPGAGPETEPSPIGTVSFGCTRENIRDLIVNIAEVKIGGQTVAAGLGATSLLAEPLNLPVGVTASGNEIRLVLNNSAGNWIVDEVDLEYPLRVPSGSTSGLKIRLPQQQQFNALTIYRVELQLDPSFVVNRQPRGCSMRPVLRASSIQPAP